MDVHFSIEHPFQGSLQHQLNEPVDVVEQLCLRCNFACKALGLFCENSIHATVSVREVS